MKKFKDNCVLIELFDWIVILCVFNLFVKPIAVLTAKLYFC